mmetsp:Transcript_3820/g.10851  ORF Transcript_3820/g.10851 Transcript_3820/m.10851 type:complete len:207 (-) Transcript_3820:1397-2017(-)
MASTTVSSSSRSLSRSRMDSRSMAMTDRRHDACAFPQLTRHVSAARCAERLIRSRFERTLSSVFAASSTASLAASAMTRSSGKRCWTSNSYLASISNSISSGALMMGGTSSWGVALEKSVTGSKLPSSMDAVAAETRSKIADDVASESPVAFLARFASSSFICFLRSSSCILVRRNNFSSTRRVTLTSALWTLSHLFLASSLHSRK